MPAGCWPVALPTIQSSCKGRLVREDVPACMDPEKVGKKSLVSMELNHYPVSTLSSWALACQDFIMARGGGRYHRGYHHGFAHTLTAWVRPNLDGFGLPFWGLDLALGSSMKQLADVYILDAVDTLE